MDWVIDDPHDWRERLPLRGAGYVCLDCRRVVSTPKQMSLPPGCKLKIVPLSWLPEKEQSSATVI